MFEFDKVFNNLKDGIIHLTNSTLEDYKDEAIQDADEFLKVIKEDLKHWTEQLSEGKLSQEDFKFLIQGKKELAQMLMLKQKGLAQVKIDDFKHGLISLVSKTIIDAI